VRSRARARAHSRTLFSVSGCSHTFFSFSPLFLFFSPPLTHFRDPVLPLRPSSPFFTAECRFDRVPAPSGKTEEKKRETERKKKKKEERNKISTAVAGGIGRRGHSPATIRQPSRYLSRIEIRRPRRRNFIKITAQILERANDGRA